MTEHPSAPEPDGDEKSEVTDLATLPDPDPEEKAHRIIKNHVVWSMGAGLVPIPLADLAGVTAIQMDALKQLAELRGVEYTEATGKRFVAALAGGLAARLGASAVKALPGIGTLVGGLSMSALSGASTYALCHVADDHFRTHGDFLEVNWEEAKAAYKVALKKGKEVVKTLEAKVNDPGKQAEPENAEATGQASGENENSPSDGTTTSDRVQGG